MTVVVPVNPPRVCAGPPATKLIWALVMMTPVGGVTWIWNVTLTVGDVLAGTDGVMMIVGDATGITLTEVETVLVFPQASETVPETVYVLVAIASGYTCEMTALPVIAPRS